MGKSRISLQTFAFGGRNKPMKPYAQLDKNSTNPLWKQIIMKFQLESGMSSVSVVLDIKTVDSVGNQLFINQQKSQYLSESSSIEKICASTLQTISDTSHLASLPFVINPGQAKYVVLTPTFSCKSNATESHIITVIINGMAQAVYPIRVYGPRSGQRSRFLKKELEDTCQPTVFVVEASENMEPNGAINSSSGVQAVRLSSSQGLRLNSSAGLPLTYEGMELESLTDAKPNVAAHHITQTNYAPMLDDDDNHYVTPDPCSDINKPWNNSGFGFSGSTNSLKTF